LRRILIAFLSVLVFQALASTQQPTSPEAVTYSADVAPLLVSQCAACHHPGGPTPFSLLTFEDAAPRAHAIADAVTRGAMPPWKPEPGYGGPFINERRLTADQIALLRRWAENGAPRGEAALAPVHLHEDWQLGTPDLVVSLPVSYQLQPGGDDVFRNFAVPIPLPSGRFVKGVEFQPTNHRVTHHVNLRIDPTAASRRLDERDREPGYEGITAASAVFPDGHFLGWTPGQVAPFLPSGLGWRLAPQSSLVVEMHLVPGADVEQVGFRVGLYFTDVPPTRSPVMLRLGKQDIDIPAGAGTHVVRDSYVLPADVSVLSVQPHAHYRARQIRGFATLQDGTHRWLIYIRDWNFHAQDHYRFANPVSLPKGTRIEMEYVYDNSAANPRNPVRPPMRVRWGQNTDDEMGDLWLQLMPRRTEDLAVLTRSVRDKERREDLIGYRVLLDRMPDDPRVHAGLAEQLVFNGQRTEAIRHFRAQVRLEPGSAGAHFNLATVLAASGQADEAFAEFTRALAIDPSDAPSHNGLGGIWLNSRRDPARALAAFQAAIRLDPFYTNAFNNMGVALARLDRHDDALIAYLAAVEADAGAVDPHFNAAGELEERGRLSEAAAHLRAALALAPEDVTIKARLAQVVRRCRC
jgi:tetratricopeptide (TPR) repeat protein/mono/diheme cytochrome c family protein